MSLKVRAKRTTSTDSGSPFRCIENFNELITTNFDGERTIDRVFELAVKKYGEKECLGTRELITELDESQSDGKVFKKAIFGDYKWMTLNEVDARVDRVGRGLAALGAMPGQNIAIFLETQACWMIAAQACFRFGFPLVTLHATLGEDGMSYSLKQTEVQCVITSGNLLMTKLKSCFEKLPNLRNVVYVDSGNKIYGLPEDIGLTSFRQLETLEISAEGKPVRRGNVSPDDIALIMYTSGTTGKPKGVMISHSNFVAATSGIRTRITNVGPGDRYIAYLPLAHVLELASETIMLCSGAKIGYSSPLTLTNRSTRIKKGSSGDAAVLKPTFMAAVPEIMERMRKSVLQAVRESNRLRQSAFHHAFNYKLARVEKGQDTPLLNKLIFKATRNLLGGHVRIMLTGGAPLNKYTQRFMSVCMCCRVAQGYGLTETCGAGAVCQFLTDYSTGNVGPPLPSCEVKLVPWEDGGYFPTNKPNPQGEIWIGGPVVTQGYYKDEEKTAEDYFVDEEGQRWIKTGDIGEVLEDGCLEIIDRKKDLVKLSHGEYLAIGNIESKLKTSFLIDNIWLYANSFYSSPMAFIVPNENAFVALAKSKGISAISMDKLCKDVDMEQEMKKAVLEAARSANLLKFEIPQKLALEPAPWTPEGGLITAAFKLKRKALAEFYAPQIEKNFPHVSA